MGAGGGAWAFTQDCHYQYCMVYSIHKEGRGRRVPRTVVVQYDCHSVGLTGGRDSTIVTGSFTKAFK